jgi:hypothetical protein
MPHSFTTFRLPLAAVLCASLAAILSACVSIQTNSEATSNLAFSNYDAAIADAAVTRPEKIMPLKALPDYPQITMVSWVNEKRLPCKPDEKECKLTTGKDRLWVTLAGEVQATCRSWNLHGDALRRRLEQLLGLPMDSPPQYRKTNFVIMQVPRDKVDRPCLGLDDKDPLQPVCTLTTATTTTATTTPELRNFVLQQMAGSYVLQNPDGPGYPFTRLGYTYDWHAESAARNHYGASEFVIAPDSTVTVLAQFTTDEYCAGHN